MTYIPMEEMMKRIGSRYKMVLLASIRTLELSEGKPKLVEAQEGGKLAITALKEIAEDKIGYKEKEGDKSKK